VISSGYFLGHALTVSNLKDLFWNEALEERMTLTSKCCIVMLVCLSVLVATDRISEAGCRVCLYATPSDFCSAQCSTSREEQCNCAQLHSLCVKEANDLTGRCVRCRRISHAGSRKVHISSPVNIITTALYKKKIVVTENSIWPTVTPTESTAKNYKIHLITTKNNKTNSVALSPRANYTD
jgi:hypothetical protein